MSAYDVVAPVFDSHRALPAGVPEAIRTAVFKSVTAAPRLLDLGAGTGRIGSVFAAAGDDYVGVDLSSGMLREFARHGVEHGASLGLAQADGEQLPFRDSVFDAVLLIQIFGGLRGWRHVLTEARRVLRRRGAIITGRTSMPPDGIDARMKQRLDRILSSLGIESDRESTREQAEDWLQINADNHEQVTAATWSAARTPRGFIERHGAGRRFSALPAEIKERAMGELSTWAAGTFGSLDAVFSEPHAFELQVFKFQHGKH
jgi:ubiquinone/menaquinone biosynthesis C-methylase UbiE